MTSTFKFDASSAAATKFKQNAFNKIKEIWNPTLQDDAVAQYAVTLLSKGQDKKKIAGSLKVLFNDDEVVNQIVDW